MEDKEDKKKRAPCAEKLTDRCSENSKDRKREREREKSIKRSLFREQVKTPVLMDCKCVCVRVCGGGVLKA